MNQQRLLQSVKRKAGSSDGPAGEVQLQEETYREGAGRLRAGIGKKQHLVWAAAHQTAVKITKESSSS